MIHCRVLGPVEVTVDGVPAPPELLWRRNLALLVYLARSPKRSRSREHLIGLLWPDKPESAARHSLNEALRPIRRCVGEHAITAQADRVQLTADAVRLDTEEFETKAQSGDWSGAAALVAGVFLEGLAIPGASGFDEWLTAEQRHWSQQAIEALLHVAERDLAAGLVRDAAAAAARALSLDPVSEAAVRVLMRALVLDGDRAGALQAFAELEERLLRDLKVSPSAATTVVMERIRRERDVGARATRARADAPVRRRAPLVGRERELASLWEVWRSGPALGSGAAAVVAGDPGVGKTRLVDELVGRIRLEGAATAIIRAVAADRDAPWNGLLGLARGGLLDAAGIAAAPPASLAWYADRIPDWADRFSDAKQATGSSTPGQALHDVLNGALEEQPVALVVDSAEWVDRESLLVLLEVLRDFARRPLFLVLAVPAGPSRAELDELQSRLGRDVNGRLVRIEPLSSDAVRHLAAWAVPGYEETALDRLTRRVYADSAGLPLLAVELLNAVALGLDLTAFQKSWPEPLKTLDQSLPGDLPEGIVSAIRVSFRRLSQDARHVLQVAAVLGAPLDAERLSRGSGLSAAAVADALDELEWNRWLTHDGRGYGFAARIVRAIIAEDQLTPGQRQRILAATGDP
jgi:DNA-binding SARP family transcriptional activator